MLNISEHIHKQLTCLTEANLSLTDTVSETETVSVSDTQIFKSIIYKFEFQLRFNLGHEERNTYFFKI